MQSIELSNEHGFVIAAIVWSVVLHHVWMASLVTRARKKYSIGYPNLYAPPGHKNRREFDCIQRAHQNSLENQPAFLVMLLVAGIKFPISATMASAVYLLGRVAYVLGYSSGNPSRRYWGIFLHAGHLALLVMMVRWAIELLGPMVKQIDITLFEK